MDQRSDEGITKETFKNMEVSSKLDVLFDLVHTINARAPQCRGEIDEQCLIQVTECDDRFKAVERRQKITLFINTTASLVGGFIGGWSAVWASFKLSIFN